MNKPLYSPCKIKIAGFCITFCLLPQVILYTQAPENQRSFVYADQIFFKIICFVEKQMTFGTKNLEETVTAELDWVEYTLSCSLTV
jgi:hypothetical protein